MKPYEIKIIKTLEPGRIQDLIINFIETSGASWCHKARFYSWDDANEAHEVKYDLVIDDNLEFFKNRWSIELLVDDPSSADNAQKVVRFGWKKLKWALEREEIRRHVMDFLDENDDAITCDCIIQVAVFKEIVYG